MHPTLPNGTGNDSFQGVGEERVGERIEALAGWIQELDAQLRALDVASDEKALKELRGALEAWSKRDPKFEERLTERVDVLSDRIATLSSAVNTTAAAHAGADGELASLRRELEQETAKLEAALQKRVQGSQVDAETIAELRRQVAELAAERPGKRGDKTTADLRARIDYVGERVDTLAKTVATTAAGLAGREGDVAALRRSLEQANAQLAELATSVRGSGSEDVGKQVEALAGRLRKSEEVVGSQLRSLHERLQEGVGALEAKLASAAADLSTKEQALATVERELGELGQRVEDATRELREAIPSEAATLAELDERLRPLAEQVEALAAQARASEELVEARLGSLDERLQERAATLDATIRATAADVSRVDSLVRELQEAVPAEALTLAELDGRLSPLTEQGVELSRRLDEATADAAESLERESTRTAGVERRLQDAERRLAALDESGTRLDASVREAQAALAALDDVSPEDLDARLEPLGTAVAALAARLEEAERRAAEQSVDGESYAADVESLRTSLESRLDALEAGSESAVAEAATRAAAAWREEQAWVREHLDALVQAVAETPTKTDVEEPLAGISARLDELERERAELAAEIARAGDAASAEQRALAAQIAELAEREAPVPPAEDEELKRLLVTFADRIEEIEGELTAEKQAARAADLESADVRAALAALEARLAATEQLVVDDDAHGVEERVETLQTRLDSLEQAVATPRAAPLAPGDGRLRVDLRALELRMEHAEAAARENLEAVLLRLERLAARLEPEAIGEVVPLRGGAET